MQLYLDLIYGDWVRKVYSDRSFGGRQGGSPIAISLHNAFGSVNAIGNRARCKGWADRRVARATWPQAKIAVFIFLFTLYLNLSFYNMPLASSLTSTVIKHKLCSWSYYSLNLQTLSSLFNFIALIPKLPQAAAISHFYSWYTIQQRNNLIWITVWICHR